MNNKKLIAGGLATGLLAIAVVIAQPVLADAGSGARGMMGNQEMGEHMGRGGGYHGGGFGGHGGYGGHHGGGFGGHGGYGEHHGGSNDVMGHRQGGWGGIGRGMGPRLADRPLSAADVKEIVEGRLAWRGNDNLKVGEVSETDEKTITVQIVTKDGSLVRSLEISRETGRPKFRF